MQQRGCCRGPRPADLSTHAERASSEEAVVCQLGGKHCCLDAERPLHRHTLPPVRSIQHLPKLAGRLLAAQMAIDPSNSNCGTAPRLLTHSSSAPQARPTKMVHLRHNQRWCTSGTTMMVHLRHNHDGAPSAQPSCCTSRVNRESARTGNIARPFVVTVDDVSPTQPPRRPGDCGPSRC